MADQSRGVRTCCLSYEDSLHDEGCDVMIKLDESFKQDGQRWVEGYTQQNTESVRARAIAARQSTNGSVHS